MGYSWTPINKGDIIRASHFNEIKNNIHDLYSKEQLNAPTWTYFPVSVGQIIRKDHIVELRSKVDYAHDQNYCREHKSSYYTSVFSGEKVGYDSTYRSSYYNDEHSTYKSTAYPTVNNNHYSTDKSSEYHTVKNTNNSGNYGSYEITYHIGDDLAIDSTVDDYHRDYVKLLENSDHNSSVA